MKYGVQRAQVLAFPTVQFAKITPKPLKNCCAPFWLSTLTQMGGSKIL